MTRVLRASDEQYPTALLELADPPEMLWIRGELPDPARCVAVVGTRTPTAWGRDTATAIARAAVERGLAVVAGLSPGIDITAHRAVLAAGGRTVAVLGSGIDRPAPREHRRDAERIVGTGGALVSEQPPGTRRSPRRLAARDRIQTALSAATIVVQTGVDSGTMTTARHALEQGRVLAVVRPPKPERDHPDAAGHFALLADPRVRRLDHRSQLLALLDEI